MKKLRDLSVVNVTECNDGSCLFPQRALLRYILVHRGMKLCQLTGLEREVPHTLILDMIHAHMHTKLKHNHTHDTSCYAGNWNKHTVTTSRHISSPFPCRTLPLQPGTHIEIVHSVSANM